MPSNAHNNPATGRPTSNSRFRWRLLNSTHTHVKPTSHFAHYSACCRNHTPPFLQQGSAQKGSRHHRIIVGTHYDGLVGRLPAATAVVHGPNVSIALQIIWQGPTCFEIFDQIFGPATNIWSKYLEHSKYLVQIF